MALVIVFDLWSQRCHGGAGTVSTHPTNGEVLMEEETNEDGRCPPSPIIPSKSVEVPLAESVLGPMGSLTCSVGGVRLGNGRSVLTGRSKWRLLRPPSLLHSLPWLVMLTNPARCRHPGLIPGPTTTSTFPRRQVAHKPVGSHRHDSEHSCDVSILLVSVSRWHCRLHAIAALANSKRTGVPTLAMLLPQHRNEQVRYDIAGTITSPRGGDFLPE